MKVRFLFLWGVFYIMGIPSIVGQTSTENYIYTKECLNDACTETKEVITYYDDLGRMKLSIDVNAGAVEGQNHAIKQTYDGFGRNHKSYMTGKVSGILFTDNIDYGLADNFVYSETAYENSPFNRPKKQSAPGEPWKMDGGHEVKFNYQSNSLNEVKRFDVTLNAELLPSLAANGVYAAGSVYKSIIEDENGNPVHEFKDKQGRVLLKRLFNNGIANNTYFVYDVYGNLTYVIPPLLADELTISPVLLNKLGYQYRYDKKNRLVEKQLPGAGRQYMVYDVQDRLAAVRDSKNDWIVTKYDKFNRAVYTASLPTLYDRSALQALYDAISASASNEKRTGSVTFTNNGLGILYTNTAFPTTLKKVFTVNYYDHYTGLVTPSTFDGQVLATNAVKTKGLIVGRCVNVLGTSLWNKDYIFYDDTYLRPVATLENNYMGGYVQQANKFDFTGKVTETTTKLRPKTNGTEIKVTEEFTYDKYERLLKHSHQINSNPKEILTRNTYNDRGLLASKKVGGNSESASLQQVTYDYNMRNWLTLMNGELFHYYIHYAGDFMVYNNNPEYNGNIDFILWKTKVDDQMRGYDYSYDGLNRLTEGKLLKVGFFNQYYYGSDGSFTEKISYDNGGNILKLERTGEVITGQPVKIDDLVYSYDGNQLLSVTDNSSPTPNEGFKDRNKKGNDYAYDVLGNMEKDQNKLITSVSYNHLNLPETIVTELGIIIFTYDADGNRLSKYVEPYTDTESTTDYINGFQYVDNVLKFFPHPEGYVEFKNNQYLYTYQYKDHLGNVRLTYRDGYKNHPTQENIRDGVIQVTEIIEENNYYPFGLKHKGYNDLADYSLTNKYKYAFGGKELNNEVDLDLHDFGARNYDAAIGRWLNVDPKAEEMRRFSPYNYAFNNPISFVDPDGMQPDGWIRDGEGNMSYHPSFTAENTPEGYTYMDMYQDENQGLSYDTNGKVSRISDGRSVDWSRSERFEGMSYHYANDGAEIRTYNRDAWNSDSAVFNDWRKRSSGLVVPESVSDVLAGIVYDYVYETTGSNVLAFAAVVILPGGTKGLGGKAAKRGTSIWTSTKKLSSVENAFGHFTKHGAEFPEFYNAKQYVEGAKNFLNNSPTGTLMKTRTNGDILKYHPRTNTFGVMDASGVPRTMFKPKDGMKYWLEQ